MSIDPRVFSRLVPPSEPVKIATVLHRLSCGVKLTRFDAERGVHDHVLNTTVSDLANDHHVEIHREWVTVPNFLGKSTHCKQYSIVDRRKNLERCYWLLKPWGYRDPSPPDQGDEYIRNDRAKTDEHTQVPLF